MGFFTDSATRSSGVLSTLLLECYHSVTLLSNVEFRHTLCEGNQARNFLANLGHTSAPGVFIFNSPPAGLSRILLGDRMGVVFPRMNFFSFK